MSAPLIASTTTERTCAARRLAASAPPGRSTRTSRLPPSPGSGAVFSLRDGRLNFTHVRQAGVFAESELAVFRAALREDLLGAPA